MLFELRGPYWHAYTSGKDMPILFVTKEDFSFVMNVIAQSAYAFWPLSRDEGFQEGGVEIITFQVMNNHLHLVLSGERERVLALFAFIKKRLSRTIEGARNLELEMKPIDNLNSLRNNIVYTNRNGYVAHPGYTPFSYPWGCSRYYFNDIPVYRRYLDLRLTPKREMFRGRAPELPGDWAIIDGYVSPFSYCAVSFGMKLFRDAHHYFNSLGKNVESYAELAQEFGDTDFLTDSELFAKVLATVRQDYKVSSLRSLSKAQKSDLARVLHYDYHSSNGQIRRVLGLTQYEVDSLFPLSVK